MSKLKRMKVHNIYIEYIPEKDFNKSDNRDKIIGSTEFKNPDENSKFFMYKNTSFKLYDYKDDKVYKGYIPVNDSFVAIERKVPLFIILLPLLVLSSYIVTTSLQHIGDKVPVITGGYDVTDNSDLLHDKSKSSDTNIYIKGYDKLFLYKNSYVPLVNSAKNKALLRFEVYNEDGDLLYKGDAIEPGKEDRFYVKDIHYYGDCTITVKAFEVIDNNTVGSGVTFKINLIMN